MESIQKYIEKISQYYKNEDSDIDIAIISSDFNDIIEDGVNKHNTRLS